MERNEQRLEIDMLKQSDSLIYFMWSDIGGPYRLHRDGELIYEGMDSSYKDEGLARGEVYTYFLERLDERSKATERLIMQTTTENRGQDTIHSLQKIAITAIVAPGRITLAWGEIEGIEKYEIYRDAELLTEINKTQFTDKNVEGNKSYTYWIRGKRPLIKSEERFSAPKFAAAKLFSLVNQQRYAEPEEEDFWITKKVGEIDRLLAGHEKSTEEKRAFDWQFRYTTFLPDDYIQSPNPLSPNRYFSGDGRSFDAEAKRYRTRTGFSLRLTADETLFNHFKSIGTSVAYDWRKKFRKADVASADDVVIEKLQEDDRKAVIAIRHRVNNPLTTSPNISYRVAATFYRSGHYDISGIHDQSPNHEVYLKSSLSDEWMQIHEAETKGLAWLSDSIACQYWRISNFT